MDKALIDRLAHEAGFAPGPDNSVLLEIDADGLVGEHVSVAGLQRFAARIAEECAKVAVAHAGICGICALAHGLSTEEGKLMERAADEASNIAAGIRAKFKDPG